MSAHRPSFGLAFVLALAAACTTACSDLGDREKLPAVGQLLLYFDTDAWLPRAAGDVRTSTGDVEPIFDKLRIEVFAPGEKQPCAECTGEFVPYEGMFRERRASFGFVPRAASGYRVRVRLYRGGGIGEMRSEPRVESMVEVVAKIPPIAEEGIVERHLFLATDDVGRPRGSLDEPVDTEPSRPSASRVGTWHAEVRRGCDGPARAHEVCVPGGALWMGNPSFDVPLAERLVALHPFYMDRTELTVRELRELGLAASDDPAVAARTAGCTFTTKEGANDDLPVNCIKRDLAAKACEARGGTLPSEAQLEYVAGAFRAFNYPWGNSAPRCEDSVFARAKVGDDVPELLASLYEQCLTLGEGAQKPGTGARDRVRTPGGAEVVDLAGNVSEWTRDDYLVAPGPCWGTAAVDPVCATPDHAVAVVKGGSWRSPLTPYLAVALRGPVDADKYSTSVGVRCVRSTAP